MDPCQPFEFGRRLVGSCREVNRLLQMMRSAYIYCTHVSPNLMTPVMVIDILEGYALVGNHLLQLAQVPFVNLLRCDRYVIFPLHHQLYSRAVSVEAHSRKYSRLSGLEKLR